MPPSEPIAGDASTNAVPRQPGRPPRLRPTTPRSRRPLERDVPPQVERTPPRVATLNGCAPRADRGDLPRRLRRTGIAGTRGRDEDLAVTSASRGRRAQPATQRGSGPRRERVGTRRSAYLIDDPEEGGPPEGGAATLSRYKGTGAARRREEGSCRRPGAWPTSRHLAISPVAFFVCLRPADRLASSGRAGSMQGYA